MIPIKTIKVTEELTLKIYYDDDCINPYDFDELGTIQAYHNKYILGHEKEFNDFDKLQEYLKNEKCVYLPLYLYDHSGITISTTPFSSCSWDSRQIGYIYVTDEKIREEYQVKRISQQLRERIRGYLINQIKSYDQYLNGDVYGYQLIKNEVCNCCKHIEEIEITSCWGYFGSDFLNNGLIDDMDTTEFIRDLIKSKIND